MKKRYPEIEVVVGPVETVPESVEILTESFPRVRFNEFLSSLKNSYLIETIGGFVNWMKRNGIPKSLTSVQWKEKLEEYINRKV
jgi:hypothetical protein